MYSETGRMLVGLSFAVLWVLLILHDYLMWTDAEYAQEMQTVFSSSTSEGLRLIMSPLEFYPWVHHAVMVCIQSLFVYLLWRSTYSRSILPD